MAPQESISFGKESASLAHALFFQTATTHHFSQQPSITAHHAAIRDITTSRGRTGHSPWSATKVTFFGLNSAQPHMGT
jgi:hypothetical protein